MEIDKLYDILRGLRGGVDFKSHETLIDDGVLDSFDIVTLVAELSDAFGITVPPEEIVPENFNSAQALFGMVMRLADE